MPTAPGHALRSEFGDIDIYLFDQLLKGRFDERGVGELHSDLPCVSCPTGDLRYYGLQNSLCQGVTMDIRE
jgi:hypothetical protein